MIPGLKTYTSKEPFALESGQALPELTIGYHTFGTLNSTKSNVIWVCHALTANSNVEEWWGELLGSRGHLHSNDYFIVCANILGSVYGTTNPLDTNPTTGKGYYTDFPQFSMRDIVSAHLLLKQHLAIESIHVCMGGSCGGQQALEMALLLGKKVENLMIIAASARETAWSIAFHTAQRMAIEADATWREPSPEAGAKGLEAARGIGLLGYRTYQTYVDSQTDHGEKWDDLKAESYIRYQGEKLRKRFSALPYWYLTKALDSHNIGRGKGNDHESDQTKIERALNEISAKTLVLGIDSDILIPPSEQKLIASHIPNAHYVEIKSPFGHDGFLIEQKTIAKEIDKFLNSQHGI